MGWEQCALGLPQLVIGPIESDTSVIVVDLTTDLVTDQSRSRNGRGGSCPPAGHRRGSALAGA